jgi:hypothetical protein
VSQSKFSITTCYYICNFYLDAECSEPKYGNQLFRAEVFIQPHGVYQAFKLVRTPIYKSK